MILARGRYWRASLSRGRDAIALDVVGTSLPEELYELRELSIRVPLEKWNPVVKHARSDRKLLGGILLDFAKHKDRLARAVGSDRLLSELQQVILEATVGAVEEEALVIGPARTPDA